MTEQLTPVAMLTERQREVLRRIAEGQGTGTIAQAMGISIRTVEFHRAQLRRKLGIQSVAMLTRYAVRAGLLAV